MNRSIETVLQKMNKEQLEGATFLLYTLHDSLSGVWSRPGKYLDNLAIAEVFEKLSEICSSLRVTTQRYKSGVWMSGALEIIEELRQYLRSVDTGCYYRVAFMQHVRDLLDTADDCEDACGASAQELIR
jgi:hypothetical protein